MTSRQNKNGYLLPDELTGYDLDCLTMKVPRNRLYQTALFGAITTLTKWWNWEKTGDNSGSIAAQYWMGLILDTYTIGPCEPKPEPRNENGFTDNTPQSVNAKIELLIDLLGELDMKYRLNGELYEVAIDLVPCGCGDDGAGGPGGSTPPLAIPGASGAAPYGELTTLCDAVEPLMSYIPQAVDDYLGRVQNVGFFAEYINADFAPLISDVLDSVDDILLQLQDETFLSDMRREIIRGFNDPWTDANRQTLRQFSRRIPLLSEGAPMQAAFVLWAETANLQAFNSAARSQTGSTSTEECAEAFAGVGRIPFDRATETPEGANKFEFEYDDGTHVWKTTLAVVTTPYRQNAEYNSPLQKSAGQVLGAAGISTSGWADVGGNPWRNPGMIVDDPSVNSAFLSADGQVPIGDDFWVGTEFVGTEMTQATFDAILSQIEGEIGMFPQSTVPTTGLTPASFQGEGAIRAGSFVSIPQNGSAVVDWLFISVRDA